MPININIPREAFEALQAVRDLYKTYGWWSPSAAADHARPSHQHAGPSHQYNGRKRKCPTCKGSGYTLDLSRHKVFVCTNCDGWGERLASPVYHPRPRIRDYLGYQRARAGRVL